MIDIPKSEPLLKDHLLTHRVETWKLGEGHYETMIWTGGLAAPQIDYVNETWDDALIAHAVAWQICHNKERLRRGL